MIWFYNFNIVKKLVLFFVVVIVLILLQGLFVMKEFKQVNSVFGEIVNKWMLIMDVVCELQGLLLLLCFNELELVIVVIFQECSVVNQFIKKWLDVLVKQCVVFEQCMFEFEEKEQYVQFGKNLVVYLKVDEQLVEMVVNQQYDEICVFFNGEFVKFYVVMVGNFNVIVKFNVSGSVCVDEEVLGVFCVVQCWIVGLLVVMVVIGLLLVFVVVVNVLCLLKEVVEIVQCVVCGDLILCICLVGCDEIGCFMEVLCVMNESLCDIVNEVCQGIDIIVIVFNEIVCGNLDLFNCIE